MSYIILDEYKVDAEISSATAAPATSIDYWYFTIVTDPKARCIEQYAWHFNNYVPESNVDGVPAVDDIETPTSDFSKRCVHEHSVDAFEDITMTLSARISILNSYEARGSEPITECQIVVARDSDR